MLDFKSLVLGGEDGPSGEPGLQQVNERLENQEVEAEPWKGRRKNKERASCSGQNEVTLLTGVFRPSADRPQEQRLCPPYQDAGLPFLT